MFIVSFLRKVFASPNTPKNTSSLETHSPLKETISFNVSLQDSSKIRRRTPQEIEGYRKKMARKEYRLSHRRLIGVITRYFVEYSKLIAVDNIYDLKKSWESRQLCAETLSKFKPTTEDFKIAYRLIKIKIIQGECRDFDGKIPDLTDTILKQVSNINKETILNNMYDRLKLYWDNVIDNYKSSRSKRARIAYLTERLRNEQKDAFISAYPTVIGKINFLIKHYEGMNP